MRSELASPSSLKTLGRQGVAGHPICPCSPELTLALGTNNPCNDKYPRIEFPCSQYRHNIASIPTESSYQTFCLYASFSWLRCWWALYSSGSVLFDRICKYFLSGNFNRVRKVSFLEIFILLVFIHIPYAYI